MRFATALSVLLLGAATIGWTSSAHEQADTPADGWYLEVLIEPPATGGILLAAEPGLPSELRVMIRVKRHDLPAHAIFLPVDLRSRAGADPVTFERSSEAGRLTGWFRHETPGRIDYAARFEDRSGQIRASVTSRMIFAFPAKR